MSQTTGDPLGDGIRLLQSGDVNGAVINLTQAVQQNPSNGQAHGYLGIAQIKLGQVNAGVMSLQQAVRLQPNDTNALYNLAVGLVQSNRPADARAALEHALTIEPGSQKLRSALDRIPAAVAASAQPVATPYNASPAPSDPVRTSLTGEPVGAPVGAFPGTTAPSSSAAAPAYPQPVYGASSTSAPAYRPGGPGMAAPLTGSAVQYAAPSTGQRVARGLGWGVVYGQWWTLLNLFWMFVWGNFSSSGSHNAISQGAETAAMVFFVVVMVLAFTAAGAIVGLIIGAANLDIRTGAIVGVVAGLLFCGLEMALTQSATAVINAFFWYFTGRFVGSRIAWRVHQPA